MTVTYSTTEAAERAGVSVRQADYWVRTGVLTIGGNRRGSGNYRRWTDEDIAKLSVLGKVSKAVLGGRPPLRATVRSIESTPPGDAVVVALTRDVALVVWPAS